MWRLVLLLLVIASPSLCRAQQAGEPRIDLQVIVVATPDGADEVAVAYATPESDEQLKQDFADIARELGNAAPQVKITRKEIGKKAIPAASARFTGITNWQTGAINLDPLVKVYRRYGHFGVNFIFLSKYPLRSIGSLHRPPVRIQERVNGNSVSYEVWVDQSRGVPETVPSLAPERPVWYTIVGLAALALVVGLSVFLIVHVIRVQRRNAVVAEGKSVDDSRS